MDFETRLILWEIGGTIVGLIIGGISVHIFSNWYWKKYYRKNGDGK